MWLMAQLSYLPLSSSKLNQIKHVYRNDEKPVSINTVKQSQAECENIIQSNNHRQSVKT